MKKSTKQNRKRWFRIYKLIFQIFIKKPQFIYLGEEVTEQSLVLSNHSGPNSPLALEFYFDKRFRMWGTYEMNGSLGMVYKYLSEVFYHQKKHWNIVAAKLFSLIAAPFAYLFYRGLRLIPSYPDARLKFSLQEGIKALEDKQNIIIFPEDSSQGYFEKLTKFHPGLITFCKYALKHNYDLKIFIAYYNKKTRQYIFDKPVLASELLSLGFSKEELCEKLCQRCNELGQLNIND